jgi:DNA-binding transcriptional LysR family regulator
LAVGPILAATDLVAVLPARVAARVAERDELRVGEDARLDPRVRFAMHWAREDDAEPGQAWLRDQLVATCRDLPPQ